MIKNIICIIPILSMLGCGTLPVKFNDEFKSAAVILDFKTNSLCYTRNHYRLLGEYEFPVSYKEEMKSALESALNNQGVLLDSIDPSKIVNEGAIIKRSSLDNSAKIVESSKSGFIDYFESRNYQYIFVVEDASITGKRKDCAGPVNFDSDGYGLYVKPQIIHVFKKSGEFVGNIYINGKYSGSALAFHPGFISDDYLESILNKITDNIKSGIQETFSE